MKKIIALTAFLVFLFTFSSVKGATIVQITKTDAGAVSTFRLGIESEEVYTLYYNQKNKIIFSLNSFYPQWNNTFYDVSVSIAAPQGEMLQGGSFYTNLYLYGFYPAQPQLDWSIIDGDSISMDESNSRSWFRVLEIGGIKGTNFDNLALDAYDGNGGFVSIRHNSNIPLSQIPEPGPPLILIASMILFLKRRWRRA